MSVDLGLAEEQYGRDSGTFKVILTLVCSERNAAPQSSSNENMAYQSAMVPSMETIYYDWLNGTKNHLGD